MKPKEKSITLSLKRWINSSNFALQGIIYAIKSQQNIWFHSIVAIIIVAVGIYKNLSIAEWLFIVLAIGGVLSVKFLNSAIEKIVNLIEPEQQKLAGQAKNMVAKAVLVFKYSAVIFGFLILLPKIIL